MPVCTPPALIRTVEPNVPKMAGRGADLNVMVRVTLDSDGNVTHAALNQTTGIPVFDEAAVAAVQKWQFQRPAPACASQTFDTAVTFKNLAGLPMPYDPCNHDAFALSITPPDYPAGAGRPSGTLTVKVTGMITSDGHFEDAQVVQSSGNAPIDQAATAAARSGLYTPRFADCKPVEGGKYLFVATFAPGPASRP